MSTNLTGSVFDDREHSDMSTIPNEGAASSATLTQEPGSRSSGQTNISRQDCDSCFATNKRKDPGLKQKCDRNRVRCNVCASKDIECTYNRVPRSRARQRPERPSRVTRTSVVYGKLPPSSPRSVASGGLGTLSPQLSYQPPTQGLVPHPWQASIPISGMVFPLASMSSQGLRRDLGTPWTPSWSKEGDAARTTAVQVAQMEAPTSTARQEQTGGTLPEVVSAVSKPRGMENLMD